MTDGELWYCDVDGLRLGPSDAIVDPPRVIHVLGPREGHCTNLDSVEFSAERGNDGLWHLIEPATYTSGDIDPVPMGPLSP